MKKNTYNIYVYIDMYIWASQVAKNLPANAEDTGDTMGLIPGWRVPPGNPGGKIPWRRAWQPTPVFLPGKAHGQRNLAGYSPRDCKELDVIYQLNNSNNT